MPEPKFTDLIRRVEDATGPNEDLTEDLLDLFYPRGGDMSRASADRREARARPSPIASLDEALSLVERCLPGCHWSGGSIGAPHSRYEAHVELGCDDEGRPTTAADAEAPTPALALILALLKALNHD